MKSSVGHIGWSYEGEHPPEHDLEELRISQQEDYETMRRQRHELLDELDMRIATLLEFVDPVQRPLAEHEYRKCSELVGTVALTWPEGT